MPAKTKKQAKFMRACAYNPESMNDKCPPEKVAREFMHTADEKPAKKRKPAAKKEK